MANCHRCYVELELNHTDSLHCSDCEQELNQGHSCDVCDRPKFVNIWDSFWYYQVDMMYAGIETLFQNPKTHHLSALALSTYTEIMGGLVTGNLKQKGETRKNYDAFLPYLGEKYVKINEELIEKETSLFESVRSKLVHEFMPRQSYAIWLTKNTLDIRIGIEYMNEHLNFHLREYYRDFKKGIEKYKLELENSKKDDEILENFKKATENNSTQ